MGTLFARSGREGRGDEDGDEDEDEDEDGVEMLRTGGRPEVGLAVCPRGAGHAVVGLSSMVSSSDDRSFSVEEIRAATSNGHLPAVAERLARGRDFVRLISLYEQAAELAIPAGVVDRDGPALPLRWDVRVREALAAAPTRTPTAMTGARCAFSRARLFWRVRRSPR